MEAQFDLGVVGCIPTPFTTNRSVEVVADALGPD
jgi:hypothetical protein